jgi:hypothetical protein
MLTCVYELCVGQTAQSFKCATASTEPIHLSQEALSIIYIAA